MQQTLVQIPSAPILFSKVQSIAILKDDTKDSSSNIKSFWAKHRTSLAIFKVLLLQNASNLIRGQLIKLQCLQSKMSSKSLLFFSHQTQKSQNGASSIFNQGRCVPQMIVFNYNSVYIKLKDYFRVFFYYNYTKEHY